MAIARSALNAALAKEPDHLESLTEQMLLALDSGEFDKANNPLKFAPHTAEVLIADHWDRQYSREVAAYPLPSLRKAKYWPPVGRADNVYGDRNLMCGCAPISAYE